MATADTEIWGLFAEDPELSKNPIVIQNLGKSYVLLGFLSNVCLLGSFNFINIFYLRFLFEH